jgi:hypothetical protein
MPYTLPAEPPAPYSAPELAIVEHFIREQSSVVMRASRMEAMALELSAWSVWQRWLRPWAFARHLQLHIALYQKGQALQLILEKQLMEALSYLNDPSEAAREVFVNGAFKALYACEEYRFGEIGGQHIQGIINKLALQQY